MTVNVEKTTVTKIEIPDSNKDQCIDYKDKINIIIKINHIDIEDDNTVMNVINQLFDIQKGCI